jgi:hypothetical protein
MTRNEALEVAKANHAAHLKARIDHMFGRSSIEPDDAKYGYLHGWYRVGDFNFNQDEITGQPYDHTQGGWAYL